MHILANIATGHVRTEEELFAFFTVRSSHSRATSTRFEARSSRCSNSCEGRLHQPPRRLPEGHVLREADERPVYRFRSAPSRCRMALHQARDDRFFHLWTICTTPDMPKLYLRRGDYAWVEQKSRSRPHFPVEDYDFFLAEVKTASLLTTGSPSGRRRRSREVRNRPGTSAG